MIFNPIKQISQHFSYNKNDVCKDPTGIEQIKGFEPNFFLGENGPYQSIAIIVIKLVVHRFFKSFDEKIHVFIIFLEETTFFYYNVKRF